MHFSVCYCTETPMEINVYPHSRQLKFVSFIESFRQLQLYPDVLLIVSQLMLVGASINGTFQRSGEELAQLFALSFEVSDELRNFMCSTATIVIGRVFIFHHQVSFLCHLLHPINVGALLFGAMLQQFDGTGQVDALLDCRKNPHIDLVIGQIVFVLLESSAQLPVGRSLARLDQHQTQAIARCSGCPAGPVNVVLRCSGYLNRNSKRSSVFTICRTDNGKEKEKT